MSRIAPFISMQMQQNVIGRTSQQKSSSLRKRDFPLNFNKVEKYELNLTNNTSGQMNISGQNSVLNEENKYLHRHQPSEFIIEGVKKQFLKQQRVQVNETELIKNQMSNLEATVNQLISIIKQKEKGQHHNANTCEENIEQVVKKMMKNHEINLGTSLKQIMRKMHIQIKEELKSFTKGQFLPVVFIDDLQKQLNQYQDKLEKLTKTVNKNVKKQIEINHDKQFAQKMNKIQVDLANLKSDVNNQSFKFQDENTKILKIIKIRQDQNQKLKHQLQSIKYHQSIQEDKITRAEAFYLFDQMYKNLNNLEQINEQLSGQIKQMRDKFVKSSDNNKPYLFSMNALQLCMNSNTKNKKQTKINDENKMNYQQYIQSILLDSSKNSLSGSKKKHSPFLALHNGDRSKISLQNSLTKSQPQQIHTLDHRKMIYKIDEQGYLMDEEGNYLLDQNNKSIYLDEQQIKLLEQVNCIEPI